MALIERNRQDQEITTNKERKQLGQEKEMNSDLENLDKLCFELKWSNFLSQNIQSSIKNGKFNELFSIGTIQIFFEIEESLNFYRVFKLRNPNTSCQKLNDCLKYVNEDSFVMLLNEAFTEITQNLTSYEVLVFFESKEISSFNQKDLTESMTLTIFSQFLQRNPVKKMFNSETSVKTIL